MLMKT